MVNNISSKTRVNLRKHSSYIPCWIIHKNIQENLVSIYIYSENFISVDYIKAILNYKSYFCLAFDYCFTTNL